MSQTKTLTPEDRAVDMIQAIAAQDIERALGHAADDIVWTDAMLGTLKGKDALRRAADDWFAQFSQMRYDVRATVRNGHLVGCHYNATAKAGGNKVAWQGAFCLAFDPQGRINAGFEIFDAEEVARQAGA